MYTAGGQQFGVLALKGERQNPIPLESYHVVFLMASGGGDF